LDAVGPAVAHYVYCFADSSEIVVGEIGYEKAVYEALARVPPLAQEKREAKRER
jgi:hypothetical protein